MTVVDQFPCDITVPVNGPGEAAERVTYREVRLLISGHDARVLGIVDGNPAALAAGRVVGTPPFPTRQVSSLATEDGLWQVGRSAGCGCHHPLRHMARAVALTAAGLA